MLYGDGTKLSSTRVSEQQVPWRLPRSFQSRVSEPRRPTCCTKSAHGSWETSRLIAFRCDQDCSPRFLMSSERSDHQSAGSLLDFVFLHETVSGAAWFGVCPQEHTVPIVVKVQGPFKGGVLSTNCRRRVDRRLVLPQADCQRSLNILLIRTATVLEPTT